MLRAKTFPYSTGSKSLPHTVCSQLVEAFSVLTYAAGFKTFSCAKGCAGCTVNMENHHRGVHFNCLRCFLRPVTKTLDVILVSFMAVLIWDFFFFHFVSLARMTQTQITTCVSKCPTGSCQQGGMAPTGPIVSEQSCKLGWRFGECNIATCWS